MGSVIFKGKKINVKGGKLYLDSKDIKDITEIEGLDSLIKLHKLVLSNNKISEIKGLEKLTKLTTLYLYLNQITEIKGLEKLTKLTTLSLNNNHITEIKGLEKLTKLTTLSLNNNHITEIKGLDSLTNLRYLYLNKNQITEIKGLERLTKLSTLYLKDNLIPEQLIEKLGGSLQKYEKYCCHPQEFVKYCHQRKVIEFELLNNIPNLQNLIRKFIYTQFHDIKKTLSGISTNQVDLIIHDRLKENISLFYDAMKSLGYDFTPIKKEILFNMMFSESEAIRNDLYNLLIKEETLRKLEEQRRKTAVAFGEEITNIDLIEKADKLKSIDDEINELLKGYEDWEHSGEGKKAL